MTAPLGSAMAKARAVTLFEARQIADRVCMGEDFPKHLLREAIAALETPHCCASEDQWQCDREDAGMLALQMRRVKTDQVEARDAA